MVALRASALVGYCGLSLCEVHIAFSDRIMVRSHLVAGRRLREGYAFLCPPQIAFRFGQWVHRSTSNLDQFLLNLRLRTRISSSKVRRSRPLGGPMIPLLNRRSADVKNQVWLTVPIECTPS